MSQSTGSQPTIPTPDTQPRGIKSTFYALSVRNYRYFWSGNIAAFFSSQMQQPTQAWLAYEITSSPLLLGLTWAAQGIPQLLIAPIGGLVIDRMQKRNLIMITQAATIVFNLAIAILISLGLIQFWHILVSSFLTGATNAFNMAARNSIVAELVPKDKMMNAIALNNGGTNLARIAGPALAGVLIGFIGTQGAYYVGIGFNVVAVIATSFLPPTSKLGMVKSQNAITQIKEGFAYLQIHNIILLLLVMEAGLTIFGMGFQGLMPVMADVLNANSVQYGFMMSVTGIGSLIGALIIASMGNFKHKGLALLVVGVAFGLSLLAFGNSARIGNWLNLNNFDYPMAMICLGLVGLFSTSYVAISMTIIQLSVSDEYRGRVFSLYQMVIALFPFSNLISGAAADAIGAELTLTIGGLGLVIFMLTMAISTHKVRRQE